MLLGCSSQSPEILQKANNLWENPAPRPGYILDVFFGQASQCLAVDLRFFTEEAFTRPNIGLQDLVDKVKFTVDGYLVEPRGLGNDRYAFFACFRIDHLPEGLHVATVCLTRFSGIEETFEWVFRVDGNLASRSSDELATLVSFPAFEVTPPAPGIPQN